MTTISRVGTALPPWGDATARQVGDDEDAVTLGVAAGRAALRADAATLARPGIAAVVLVTRDLPLLDGDSGAPLLAGLGLTDDVPVHEVVGGAPAVLDAIVGAGPATLVIGVDAAGAAAGASAVWCDGEAGTGAAVTLAGRVVRSLPVTTRDASGHTADYADPRLLRELGVNVSLARLGDPKPVAVAGLAGRGAAAISAGPLPVLPTTGASAVGFALAALAEQRACGPLLAVEQATVTLAEVASGPIDVVRDEPARRPRPQATIAGDASIAVSLPAYERAFDAKLRLAAARCTGCGTLSFPPRYRCLECGAEGGLGVSSELVPLPRRGEVYSLATIRVPVPGLVTPYSVVIVELGDIGVRTLVRLTGVAAGAVAIGDTGTLVLRRVAVRQGVPDYGYAFRPDEASLSGTAAEQGAA